MAKESESGGNERAMSTSGSSSGPAYRLPTAKEPETPFTSRAKDLLKKSVEAYRADLVGQSRAMARDAGIEVVHMKLVARARRSSRWAEQTWRRYWGALGGLIAGACLSNLLQMFAFQQKIPPSVGFILVIFLVVGTGLVTYELGNRRR